jgi:WD40 repeat protein
VAKAEKPTRTDRYGDPLPEGALMRLGSVRFRVPNQIVAVAVAPNGKTLAVSSHAGLFILDAVSGKRLQRLPTPGRHWTEERKIAFSPDSKRLICQGPKKVGDQYKAVVRVWELKAELQRREYDDVDNIISLGWSADGQPLAICVEEGTVRRRELESGQSRRFECKNLGKRELWHLTICARKTHIPNRWLFRRMGEFWLP